MFDSENLLQGENEMDLSSIDSANFDAMVAEEAILDWLVNLETNDTDFEFGEAEEFLLEPARLAN